jgi:Calponin homology (CH) domain
LFNFSIQLAGKRNADQEKEAQEWIETILGAKFPPGESYEDALKDGIILCKLMNKLKPGSVAKVNTSGASFKMMENINLFQKACREYGVADLDVFQTVDLWEQKDISQVTMTLFALGREVNLRIVNFSKLLTLNGRDHFWAQNPLKRTFVPSTRKRSPLEKPSSVSRPAATRAPHKPDRTWALAAKSSSESEVFHLDFKRSFSLLILKIFYFS